MKPSFMAIIKTHHGDLGTEARIIIRYKLSPEGQRDLFMKAIVGYDAHHPDSPGFDGLKFPSPPPPPPLPKPTPSPPPKQLEEFGDDGDIDASYYCG